ncbi:MAG: IS256 family transposase [Pirellulaceae bacterium]|nr:IS256 family transposase [Pirellulaceae bacterium]
MTRQVESNPFELMVQVLEEQGFDGMANALQILVNEAMLIERSEALRAEPYERTSERRGYANGFKPKTLNTRVGQLELQVPQTRGVEFYPKSLERGVRSERALKLAVAEMYVQGVSTRKVTEITQQLCGLEVSSSQVSRAAALLDEELQSWRTRPLGKLPYLIIDARYEKVRHGGSVVDCAVLVAVGVLPNGKRTVLGVSAKLSEAEVHWRAFLSSLVERGLHGVELITSDAHEGLKAARQAVFPGVPWQRCQFHLQQNAAAYVPKVDMRTGAAADLRGVFNAPNASEAQRLLKLAVERYRSSAPKLADWMEANVPEGLTVLERPTAHRRRLRTTNMLERLNKEIHRRTRVATLFPNEPSLLRLVSAVLAEVDEEWQTAKCYLTIETDS